MKDNKVLLELARKTISSVSSVDAEFVETAPIGIVDFEKWEWTQGVGLFALWQYYKLSGDVSVRKKSKNGIPTACAKASRKRT